MKEDPHVKKSNLGRTQVKWIAGSDLFSPTVSQHRPLHLKAMQLLKVSYRSSRTVEPITVVQATCHCLLSLSKNHPAINNKEKDRAENQVLTSVAS